MTIKGKRNENILNEFTFYLKKSHSDICNKSSNGLEKKIIENINTKDVDISNNTTNQDNEIINNTKKKILQKKI